MVNTSADHPTRADRSPRDRPATVADAADADALYRALARDPRYGHYVRIPARVCKCLDHFGATYDREAVMERLHAYYLFIGVADDALDSRGIEAGREILRRLRDESSARPDDETAREDESAHDDEGAARPGRDKSARTPVELATEALKRYVAPEVRPRIIALLDELYRAAAREQSAGSVGEYVEERKRVGCLTAEASYVLVEPLIKDGSEHLRCFLASVGEVGCLVDSVIDLRADASSGALGFAPSRRDRLRLLWRTLREGAPVLLGRPRLARLFLEAVGDDLRDRRVRGSVVPPPPAGQTSGELNSVTG